MLLMSKLLKKDEVPEEPSMERFESSNAKELSLCSLPDS